MKIDRLLFLIFLIPIFSYAQDCGSVKDGVVIRLDHEGNSLAKSKVQDQDGIGSCYANTASVMLQAILPNNPDVSYINLALQNAEKFNVAKPGSFAFMKDDKLLLNGGFICDVFKSAKDNGGVCNRKDVPLENIIFNSKVDGFHDANFIQQEVITKVSTYYDQVNLIFNKHNLNLKKISSIESKLTPKPGQINYEASYPEEIKVNNETKIETRMEPKKEGFFSSIGKAFKNFFGSIFNKNPAEKSKETVNDPLLITKELEREKNAEKKSPDKKTENDELNSSSVLPPALAQVEMADSPDESIEDNSENQSNFKRSKFEKLKKLKRPLTPKENYQLALYNLFQKKPEDFSLKNCEVLDPANALALSQNLAGLIYNDYQKGLHTSVKWDLRNILYSGFSTSKVGETETINFFIDDKLKKIINEKYLKSFRETPAPKSGKEAFLKAVKTLMSKSTTDKDLENILDKLDSNVLGLLEDDYNRYVKLDYSKCKQDKITYLLSPDGFIKDFQQDQCLANYSTLTKGLSDMISGLSKSSLNDFEKVVDAILSAPDLNYEDALTKSLAPACNAENKIQIPKNYSCNSKDIELAPESFDGTEKEKINIATETNKFRQDLVKSIGAETPVGVSLCTIFFQEDSSYNYNKTKKCEVNREHSFHAVSVIGYRCQKGKMDYLIQNSWGEWRNLNSAIERDSKYGKAWFSEESMMKNSYNYSIMSK